MSWEMFSNGSATVAPEDWLEFAIRAVRKVVIFYKRRGSGFEVALEQAALDFGMTERRAKSLYYRELTAITRNELLNIVDRYPSIAEKLLTNIKSEAEGIEHDMREMLRRRDQYRLELGGEWPQSCVSMLGEYGRSFATLGRDGSSSRISPPAAKKRP